MKKRFASFRSVWCARAVKIFAVSFFAAYFWACDSSGEIVILSSDHTSGAELDSLARIIRDGGNRVTVVPASDLTGERLKGVGTVIYHRSDSSDIDSSEIALKTRLIPYVEKGGNLMLSMEAVRLLNDWGIEPQPLETEYQDATDNGYGRAVGYHGYREHPIYEGLFGGAYVWKAKYDHRARTLGFSGDRLPRAEGTRVLGVNWAYIHYHEDRKIVWETPVGEGKILAVGGYLHFSEPNVNRTTLERFTRNVADYLNNSRKFRSREKAWAYDTIPVQKTDFPEFRIPLKEEFSWEPESFGIAGIRTGSRTNYWDMAGQQILAMGMEQGPIEEVWIHPVMALRDMVVGIRYKGGDDIVWMDTQRPEVTVSPEFFERSYTLPGGGGLREIITVSPDQPLMAINYRWDDPDIGQVYVVYTTNLRLMWPYSLDATGTLFYADDQGGAVTAVFDRARELNVMTAFDRRPEKMESGMFDFSRRDVSAFGAAPAKHKQITFLYTFSGEPGKLNFYLSGGESGLRQSADLLKKTMGDTQGLYRSAADYYRSFDRDFLQIESSDTLFNRAYRWALVSVDKFFCHTPSIGKSMMSGYWTTARGWNGGHEVSGRPGYAWYFARDTELTGIAMNDYGDYGKVRDILETFGKYQDPDGKVYHELTTSGSAHYDASDATPLYLVLAGDYLRKTGDAEFIRSQWPNLKKALGFCYSTDTDGDLLIENTNVGHGWQEGWQLYGAHTEVYLAALWAQALREASYMASVLGEERLETKSREDMATVKRLINENFWNDSMQFFNHGLMKDGSYQEQKCVLGGTPLLFNLTDSAKAVNTAGNFSNKYFSTDWGVRMVGYDSPYYFLGGYNYGNIWPFHTGCAALAECRAGLRYQGFRHAYGTLRLFEGWDYGNISEVILGDKLQFTGICPHQQWSSSMSLLPLYEGMLGLGIDALKDSLTLAPAFPADWSFARVKNIRIRDNRVRLDYERTGDGYRYILTNGGRKPVNLNFSAVLPLATVVREVTVDGVAVPFSVTEEVQNVHVRIDPLHLTGKSTVNLLTEGGIAVLLNLPPAVNDMPDDGLKIEGERFDPETGIYTLELAGKPGRAYDVELLTLSAISETEGAVLKKQEGDRSVYTVKFANKNEPFVDGVLKLKIGNR